MDKITITELGRSILSLQSNPSSSILPPLQHLPSTQNLQENQHNIAPKRDSSKGRLNVSALRTILRDQTLSELNKLKEHTNQQAYRFVKHQLMRDITASCNFLEARAEVMARRMLAEERPGGTLQTEIGKGRNYLSKLVSDHQTRLEEEEQLRLRLRQRSQQPL